MSSSGAGAGADAVAAWPTNESKSVNADFGGSEGSRDLPTPSEVSDAVYEELGSARWNLPLTARAGDTLRERYAETFGEWWEGISYGEFEAVPRGYQTTATEAVTWGDAVETLVERHEEVRRTTVNLERGWAGEPLHAEWSVEAENRWMEGPQEKMYGQLQAWVRELVGGERPSGGEVAGAFEEPFVALLGLTASSVPGGERVGPVRHATALQESWELVYHTLRNTMRSLGFSSDEWQYVRVCEPHTSERGGGKNAAHLHEHPILIVDGELSASDLRPVMEKHAEACEYAGASAHQNRACEEHYGGDYWNDARGDCDDCQVSVSVRKADGLADVAAYMAKYGGIAPMDLLERPPEYVAWAAAMDAANVRTFSRSVGARHAALADLCKQRHESEKSDQEVGHGEEVVMSVKRGCRYECAECGSPWGIDQEGTLAAKRVGGGESAAADGGRVSAPQNAHTREALASAWPSAREAAAVGESPTVEGVRERVRREVERRGDPDVASVAGALGEPPPLVERVIGDLAEGIDPSVAVGFGRLPEWRVVSVSVGEEEHPASRGGGVSMVTVDPRPPSDTSAPTCPSCGAASMVDVSEAGSVHEEGTVCTGCGWHPAGHDLGVRR